MAAKPLNRAVAYPLTYLFVFGGYMLTNHLSGLQAPHLLPLSAVDRAVPFLPWTGWIYVTVFPFPLFALAAVRAEEGVRALLASFVALAAFCFACFLLYPTVYPRPPMSAAGPAAWPLLIVRALDRATNCCPSMHVISAFLTAFFVRRYRPALGAGLVAWASLISLSTLTTKQHYAWDVAAGLALSAAAYALTSPRAAAVVAATAAEPETEPAFN